MPEALLNGVHEHLVPHESRFGRLHVRPHDLELVAVQVFPQGHTKRETSHRRVPVRETNEVQLRNGEQMRVAISVFLGDMAWMQGLIRAEL